MTRLPDTRFRARHSPPGAAFPALHNEARLGAAGAPPARSPWAGRQPCRRAAASSTQGTPYKAPSSPEASGFTETAKKPPSGQPAPRPSGGQQAGCGPAARSRAGALVGSAARSAAVHPLPSFARINEARSACSSGTASVPRHRLPRRSPVLSSFL